MDVPAVATSIPFKYLQRLIEAFADLLENSPHLEFILRWCQVCLWLYCIRMKSIFFLECQYYIIKSVCIPRVHAFPLGWSLGRMKCTNSFLISDSRFYYLCCRSFVKLMVNLFRKIPEVFCQLWDPCKRQSPDCIRICRILVPRTSIYLDIYARQAPLD